MTSSTSSIAKAYQPKDFEKAIYQQWEESGAFKADASSNKKPFSLAMPPPNATGVLHVGHAVMLAIEDVLIRWHRMQGYETLWIPGTDHAAIATESVVLNKIKAEEKMADPRKTLGRDEVLRRIHEYVANSQGTIRSQIRAMGSSCDWSREHYTMEATLNRCVNETFLKMFEDGLIYQGVRIVNWDPSLQTTVSDDEIVHQDTQSTLYYLKYGPLVVATSRPETKIADTAVAVHPDDPRYQQYLGQTLEVPWPKGPTIRVKVIGDKKIDPEFGSGALGVTPAHSQVDYAMAEEHGIDMIQVIDESGCMTDAAGPYAGMTVSQCREAFVQDLRDAGLMEKEEPYQQALSICYRSKKPIEPLPKKQWFIDVNKAVVPWKGKQQSLKEILIDVVRSNDVAIVPERFNQTYFYWVENLRDWCISRQIWWGHRIPVWYQGDAIQASAQSPGDGWEQDPDTLDTWFSSALWTWSTLIDSDAAANQDLSFEELLQQSPDFQKFHPTQVMETGYDILFFWVARMILMTTYMTKQIPFETVYLHGMVRTKDGRKMSKSDPKTCIDPLESIDSYGTDALRIALMMGTGPGMDFKVYPEKLESCRRFVNKIWNAGRYILMTIPENTSVEMPTSVNSPIAQWMLHRLNLLVGNVQKSLTDYRISHVIDDLRSFIWGDYCDWFLEMSKKPEQTEEDHQVLAYSYTTLLKLLHPYVPFVTEALWSHFPTNGLLITSDWPEVTELHHFPESEQQISLVKESITQIRALRDKAKIGLNITIPAYVESVTHALLLQQHQPMICRLARLDSLQILPQEPVTKEGALQSYFDDVLVRIDAPAVDVTEEKNSLQKALKKEEDFLQKSAKKLDNPGFLAKAPEAVVAELRDKLAATEKNIQALQQQLNDLESVG